MERNEELGSGGHAAGRPGSSPGRANIERDTTTGAQVNGAAVLLRASTVLPGAITSRAEDAALSNTSPNKRRIRPLPNQAKRRNLPGLSKRDSIAAIYD